MTQAKPFAAERNVERQGPTIAADQLRPASRSAPPFRFGAIRSAANGFACGYPVIDRAADSRPGTSSTRGPPCPSTFPRTRSRPSPIRFRRSRSHPAALRVSRVPHRRLGQAGPPTCLQGAMRRRPGPATAPIGPIGAGPHQVPRRGPARRPLRHHRPRQSCRLARNCSPPSRSPKWTGCPTRNSRRS